MQTIYLNLDKTLIIAMLLFSAIVSIILCVYIIEKSRSGKIMHFFILGQLLTIIWSVFSIFELLALNVEIRWFIVCIQYFPLSYVGFAFLHFAYAYTRHRMMKNPLFYFTLLLPTVGYIAALTNPLHYLFYSEFTLYGERFGPFCYLTLFTTVAYLLLGASCFLDKMYLKSISRKKQSMYFVIAMIVPVIAHLFLVTKIINFGFTITLLFIPFSVLLFIVAVFKYQFLDVLPIAINDTIESMYDGMIVINSQGKIMDYNTNFFKRIFGIGKMSQCETITDFYERIKFPIKNTEEFLSIISRVDHNVHSVLKGKLEITHINNETFTISVIVTPLMDRQYQKIATLITFFDISEVFKLYQTMELKNAELLDANNKLKSHIQSTQMLTTEVERNSLMADIHDTLGHSMMELLALLEVTDLILNLGQENVIDTIEEAIDKARNSLREVREAVAKYKKMGGIA
jgi:signal transduction histidine kinase